MEKFDKREISENMGKIFFSAKQKATSSKLGTYVGHDVKYVPVIFQPSSSILTARKKLKTSPPPHAITPRKSNELTRNFANT